MTSTRTDMDINKKNLEFLLWAIEHDYQDCLKAILSEKKANVDPNQKNHDGYTPLMVAASHPNREDCVKILLDFKSDLNVLANRKSGNSTLHIIVEENNLKALKIILEAKPNLNICNASNDTPLITAAYMGNNDCLMALITAKADLDIKGDGNTNALYWAVAKNRELCVQNLIFAKSNLNVPALRYRGDEQGETALECAVRNKNLVMMTLLLTNNAIIRNSKDLLASLSQFDQRHPDVFHCLNIYFQHLIKSNLTDTEEFKRTQQYLKKMTVLKSKIEKYIPKEISKCVPSNFNKNLINIINSYNSSLENISFFKPENIDSAIAEYVLKTDNSIIKNKFL